MQRSLEIRAPDQFVSGMEKIMQRYSLEQKEREFTIAAEIYLAKFFTEIRYTDLMRVQDASHASSERLLGWLNDHVQTGREGFLTKYIKGTVGPHDHFRQDGTWLASYLPDAMEMFYNLTQDKEFISIKSVRDSFLRSFSNERWVLSATAITGLKLMEMQAYKGLLMSNVAGEMIGFNNRSRGAIDRFGGIVGRAAKNNELRLDEWLNEIRDYFKLEHRRVVRTIELCSDPEYKLFTEIGSVFHHQILSIPRLVQGEINAKEMNKQ